jgi:hypothetical protein
LKGAVALDDRLGDRARATMDLDLAHQDHVEAANDDLLIAQATDLGDYFTFQIERTTKLDNLLDGPAVRYRVVAQLDGRPFEVFNLDVGFVDQIDFMPDRVQGPDLFGFAGIEPVLMPTLPLEQHVAEKPHAYVRTYREGRHSSRVKDLIDLVLISSNASLESSRLRAAITATLTSRIHDVPASLLTPPSAWRIPYRRLAEATHLDPEINAGYQATAAFLDPVLSGTTSDAARWNPLTRVWQTPAVADPTD